MAPRVLSEWTHYNLSNMHDLKSVSFSLINSKNHVENQIWQSKPVVFLSQRYVILIRNTKLWILDDIWHLHIPAPRVNTFWIASLHSLITFNTTFSGWYRNPWKDTFWECSSINFFSYKNVQALERGGSRALGSTSIYANTLQASFQEVIPMV